MFKSSVLQLFWKCNHKISSAVSEVSLGYMQFVFSPINSSVELGREDLMRHSRQVGSCQIGSWHVRVGNNQLWRSKKENIFFFFLWRPSGMAVSNKRSIKGVRDLCKIAFRPGKKLK